MFHHVQLKFCSRSSSVQCAVFSQSIPTIAFASSSLSFSIKHLFPGPRTRLKVTPIINAERYHHGKSRCLKPQLISKFNKECDNLGKIPRLSVAMFEIHTGGLWSGLPSRLEPKFDFLLACKNPLVSMMILLVFFTLAGLLISGSTCSPEALLHQYSKRQAPPDQFTGKPSAPTLQWYPCYPDTFPQQQVQCARCFLPCTIIPESILII